MSVSEQQLREEEQPPASSVHQRKCGVHLLPSGGVNNSSSSNLEVAVGGRSVDSVVEAYLDENADFLDDYVRRKVNLGQLERWLFVGPGHQNAKLGSTGVTTGGLLSCVHGQPGQQQPLQQPRQRQRSRSFTPLRKLSASTFEEGGLATPILATTSDGQPSFLRTQATHDENAQKQLVTKPHIILTNSVQTTHSGIADRKDLLLKLLPDILASHDLQNLARTLTESVKLLMGGVDRASLLVLTSPNAFEGHSYTLHSSGQLKVHKVCSVDRLATGALTACQVLNVADLGDDLKLPPDHYRVDNALVGPLVDRNGCTIGCVQLYNKTQVTTRRCSSDNNKTLFHIEDEILFKQLLSVASKTLATVLAHQEMRLELARSEVFLELARTVFREPSRLEPTMLTILTNFLSLIDCERCQILLSDQHKPTVFKRVFDLERNDLVLNNGGDDLEAPFEGRFPINAAITGEVARTGKRINLKDATKDHRFDRGMNADAQLQHRSFLCMPIRDPDDHVLGVISLINKEISEQCDLGFTSNDERFVEAFAVFCGMAIRNAADYEKAVVSEAKLQVAFEVMNFQATSTEEEATALASLPILAAATYSVDSLDFNYLNMDDSATLTATIRMFIDLGLLSRFSVDYYTLCRWLLTVKRNYRNETVQYHNWYHAFNVTQMMFCMLTKTGFNKMFSMTDCLGLLVACICHDLDHRGTNNSFQAKMNNPLAKLYSTSTLERHHLNQCLLILNLKGNRILENLTQEEYTATLTVIESSILATDLALHFRQAPSLRALAANVNSNLKDANNRTLLQNGLMTAADLGAVTKPWPVHRAVSQLIAEEFWTQGDIERRELHVDPPPMLDRHVALSTVQIGFIDHLCMDVYENMAKFSPTLQPLVDGCLANRARWTHAEEEEQKVDQGHKEHAARNL